ncbi:LysR family transcriptional regulator [Primorskyibacter sp. S187A]|uniref:LysR family transcriptional regulator n=1 Tax=Primorskyibacter sp. S187A TaxID=3415130 RepID=UPI003C7D9F6A
MNETHASLDDLLLFALVAQMGSLSAASRQCDMPLPTVSRRMAGLERDLGRKLFVRGARGYALTADGRSLAEELEGLAHIRARVRAWSERVSGPVAVRITAGTWSARHIALNLPPISQDALWAPVFVPSDAKLDLARREADVGIRNAAPDHNWLAGRKLAPVEFAIYGRPEATGFIASTNNTPSQNWLQAHFPEDIRLRAGDPRLALDLALAGHGRVLLPMFAGRSTELNQVSEPIDALRHEAWLVVHDQARHEPPIRAALDMVGALFEAAPGA